MEAIRRDVKNYLWRLVLKLYKIVCITTSALFIFLFLKLLLSPESFVSSIGLQPTLAASVLARRASSFMLGISILLFSAKGLAHSKARQYICLSTGITMVGLACAGIYEYIMGSINSSIFIAIITETILGFTFLIVFFTNRKAEIIQ
jgi:hypothetical protein